MGNKGNEKIDFKLTSPFCFRSLRPSLSRDPRHFVQMQTIGRFLQKIKTMSKQDPFNPGAWVSYVNLDINLPKYRANGFVFSCE
jgi:hypothetical protein